MGGALFIPAEPSNVIRHEILLASSGRITGQSGKAGQPALDRLKGRGEVGREGSGHQGGCDNERSPQRRHVSPAPPCLLQEWSAELAYSPRSGLRSLPVSTSFTPDEAMD